MRAPSRELAANIGAKVDILVNTAEVHRANAVSAQGVETARAEMEVNYFGLLRSPRPSRRRSNPAPRMA